MLPTLFQVAVVVDFEINRDYISRVLCEKRDEPVNTCNGTCHLAKELKKTEESEQHPAPLERNQQYELTLYVYEDSASCNAAIPFLRQLRTPFNLHRYTSPPISGLLRPPQNLIARG